MGLTRLEAEIKASLVNCVKTGSASVEQPRLDPRGKSGRWQRGRERRSQSAILRCVGARLWDETANTRQDGNLRIFPLMLESEWGDWDAISYDFEKLLAARAAHRVMVRSASSQSRAEEIFQEHIHSPGFSGESGWRLLSSACWYGRPERRASHIQVARCRRLKRGGLAGPRIVKKRYGGIQSLGCAWLNGTGTHARERDLHRRAMAACAGGIPSDSRVPTIC